MLGGTPSRRRPRETLAVVGLQAADSGAAQRVRLFQHRVEHRREVAGRGIDDPQHLGGRGLLLQGLARLGDQPRILHRDDRLRREILQQRDLLVGERPDLLAIDGDVRRAARRPCAAAPADGADIRRARRSAASRIAVGSSRGAVGDLDERSPRRSLVDRTARTGAERPAAAIRRNPAGTPRIATASKRLAVDRSTRLPIRGPAQARAPFPASRRTPARDRRARS